MEDVLGRPVTAISEKDYERESMKVLTTAWICFSGEQLDRQKSGKGGIFYFPPADHFVDERLLITIVSKSTENILTCYHEDFNRAHKPSIHKLEQMVRYIEHLGDQCRGNMLKNFAVEKFLASGTAHQVLEAELAKMKTIPERSRPAA